VQFHSELAPKKVDQCASHETATLLLHDLAQLAIERDCETAHTLPFTNVCIEMEHSSAPTLEVGGTGKSCVASKLPNTALVISLINLPNPYTAISRNSLEREPKAIINWMIASDKKAQSKLESAVEGAVCELTEGRSVRLECYGGRDRSQAVAWKVLHSLREDVRQTVVLECLDASVMECLGVN
jgi:RNase adaptor protein for sRNA GlmZ degradation